MIKKIKKYLDLDKDAVILAVAMFVIHLLFPQYTHAATISNDDLRLQLSELNIAQADGLMLFNPSDGDPDELIEEPKPEEAKGNKDKKQLMKKNIRMIPLKYDLQEIKDFVLNEAKSLGLNPAEVEKIIRCESRWNPGAANYRNRNGSYDLGLWQINSVHKSLSDKDKLDFKKATRWALAKRVNEGNWSAWYCAKKLGIN